MSDDLLLAGLTAGDAELSVAFVRRFQGPVFGVAGHWWRGDGPWRRAIGPALLGASAMAEGVYLAGIPTVASAGPLFVIVGVLIPVLLGRRRDDRIRGLILLLPCVALGAAGFMATIALNGLLVGL